MVRSDKGSSEQYTRLYYALHCVKFGPKADNEDNIITFLDVVLVTLMLTLNVFRHFTKVFSFTLNKLIILF